MDVPTEFPGGAGNPPYKPVNYDGEYRGPVQIRYALANSINVPAVKTLALTGIKNVLTTAYDLGVTSLKPDQATLNRVGLSLTLGGGEVRPLDMAVAFGVFANSGIRQSLNPILKVEDWKGKVYQEFDPQKNEGVRVVSPEVAFLISHTLHDNNARTDAFGPSSLLNVRGHGEVSVKTGTTNDRRDNWTIGYTKDVVVTVWVGNNDNTAMKSSVSGVSGASPIWNTVMRKALEIYEPVGEHPWPKSPDAIVGKSICSSTGLLSPGPGACPERFEYFLAGTVPATSNIVNQDLFINNATGQVAGPTDPPDQIHTENKPTYTDPDGTLYCLTCPIASASATIRYPLY